MASEIENEERILQLQREIAKAQFGTQHFDFEQRHGGELKVVTDPTPLPIHDPIERRAISLRMAIECRKDWDDAVVLGTARAFEAFIAGQEA